MAGQTLERWESNHDMSLKKIKTLSSYAAHARFLAECSEIIHGYIPRQVPTPYQSGPTHNVMEWNGKPVIVAETAHRRYEVFEVLGQVFKTEDEAMAARNSGIDAAK